MLGKRAMSMPPAFKPLACSMNWLAKLACPSQSSERRKGSALACTGHDSDWNILRPSGVAVGVPSTRYGMANAATAESAVAIERPCRVVAVSDGHARSASILACAPGSSCANAAPSTASATSGRSAGGVSFTAAASE